MTSYTVSEGYWVKYHEPGIPVSSMPLGKHIRTRVDSSRRYPIPPLISLSLGDNWVTLQVWAPERLLSCKGCNVKGAVEDGDIDQHWKD